MKTNQTATSETKPKGPGICLVTDCGNKANWRGICLKCRKKAKEHMKATGKSWADLEKAGLVGLAPERGPRGKSQADIARDTARDAWFGKLE